MSPISGINGSPDYSSLFGGLTTNNSSSGSTGLLSDWASIKNGSYGKLTKAYYGKDNNSKASAVNTDDIKATIKGNTMLKSSTNDMKSALSSLESAGLYEKVSKKDADGNETKDYDMDKIVKNLKSFVDGYNSIVENADDSDNKGILRNAASMTKITAANRNVLSKIGITVGEDNKLKLDEETAKKANVTDITSMFQGLGSYGSQIDSRATELVNQINAENNKLNMYTKNGGYGSAAAIGNIYDGTY